MAYGIAMETWWLAFLNLVCATPPILGVPICPSHARTSSLSQRGQPVPPTTCWAVKDAGPTDQLCHRTKGGFLEDHSGANFTVNHHDRVHGRMTIVHSSRALQVIHRNVHHSFPYSPRIPAIILDLFISLLFFWQLKCMQTLGFCWKSGVPSTRSPASLEEDEVLEDDLGTWSHHPGRTSARPGWGAKRLREGD